MRNIFSHLTAHISWKTVILVTVLAFFGSIAIQSIPPLLAHAASGSTNLEGYAWSSTIGWISFNSNNQNSGGGSYAVSESSTGALSGYAWSPNIGWVSFNSSDVSGCPSGSCAAQVQSNGNVTGWARAIAAPAAGSDAGGWGGWIELSGVKQSSNGAWSGYAWGGGSATQTDPNGITTGVIGWVNFSGVTTSATVPKTGTLTASPSPCTIKYGQSVCSTTITITAKNTVVEVIVGTGSKVFYKGTSGTKIAPWITSTGSTFNMYDYSTGIKGKLLDSLFVKGVTALPKSCTLPWKVLLDSGSSVTAYKSPTVVSPATCSSFSNSETLTCTNGVLSTNRSTIYQNRTCSVTAPPTIINGILKIIPDMVPKNKSVPLTFNWELNIGGGGGTLGVSSANNKCRITNKMDKSFSLSIAGSSMKGTAHAKALPSRNI